MYSLVKVKVTVKPDLVPLFRWTFMCRRYRNPNLLDSLHSLSLSPPNHNHFNQILSLSISSGLFSQHPFLSSKLLLYSFSLSDNPLSFSRSLFFQIPNPNIFAWNFMFKAYSLTSFPLQSLLLYNLMRTHFSILPDNYSFPFLLKACARLSLSLKAQELHSLIFKLGYQLDIFVQNSLIYIYFQFHMVQTAYTVFHMIPISLRDVISWNTMISGYLHNNRSGQALHVLKEMLSLSDRSLKPDEVTMVSSLAACGRITFLHLGRTIHGLLITHGFILNVFSGSSLIDMYAKCGRMEDAIKVFDRIPQRNVVCWTCLIAGYVKSNLFKEAIQLFKDMQLGVGGIMPDSETAACVISACGQLGALDQGIWVHALCERNGIYINLSFKNALIDMYSKCGNVERALEIFQALTQRDIFSWTAMIGGLALNGKCDKALQLFSQMETSGEVRPNEVTFLGVLSACCHGGYVDRGFHYLEIMTQIYHLTPRIEHYGCMVDLLGRANLLAEAEFFIRAMPIRPDVVIWRSLLFACYSNRNIELAELSIKKIEELEPQNCSAQARILLSNTYASASMWYDANKMRKYENTKKQPGCSLIEIDGAIHEFFAGDNLQRRNISTTILGLDYVVRSTGLSYLFEA